MKITNKTHWDTKAIKKLFAKCVHYAQKEGEDAVKCAKGLTILIRYGKQIYFDRAENVYYGKAYFGKRHYFHSNDFDMFLWIPREILKSKKLARLFLHEFDHSLGYHHREMENYYHIDVDWLEDYNIEKIQKKGGTK